MLTTNSNLQEIEQLIESIENGAFDGSAIYINSKVMDGYVDGRDLQKIAQLIESIEKGTFEGSTIYIKSAFMDDNFAGRLCAALKQNTAVAAKITSITIKSGVVMNFAVPDTLIALEYIDISGNGLTILNMPDRLMMLTVIKLYGNLLTSLNIPDTLTALEKIDLHCNRLTGLNIPNTLTALKEIDLHDNRLISFNIPDTLIALKEIFLYENRLASINVPDTLIALRGIYLGSNALTGFDIPGTLTALKEICLGHNQLNSFNIPDKLTELEDINLGNNLLTNFNIPDTLTALKVIDLNDNELISLNLPNTLTALESIYLLQNHQLTDIKTSATIHNLCHIYARDSYRLSDLTKWKLTQSFAHTDVEFNHQAINVESIREYYNTFCATKRLIDHAMTSSLKLQITRDIINSHLINAFCIQNTEDDHIGVRIAGFLMPKLGLDKSLDSCGLNVQLRAHALHMLSPEIRAEVESLNTKVIADATSYEKTKFLYYNFNRIKNSNLGRDVSFINTIEILFPSEQSAEYSVMSQSRQKPKRIKL